MNVDLERMRAEWERREIKRSFPRIHHFSDFRFETKPSGLVGFYNWCSTREIASENQQTLNRALEVIQLLDRGIDLDSAVNGAWEKFPVVNR